MFFVFGTRTYGKCDKVGELFYVVTKFAHINFVPLFPAKSYIVLKGSESGGQFRGMDIGLSGRSVLHAYARAGSILGIVIGVIGMMCVMGSVAKSGTGFSSLLAFVTLSLISAFILVLSYATANAGYARAIRLAEQIGVPTSLIDREYAAHSSGQRPFERDEIQDVIPADYDERFLERRDR